MKFEIAPKSTEIQSTWDDARLYCFSLNIDGKVGWRLPTKQELNEIYQSENDFRKTFYWSSTEASGVNAWAQGFNGGYQYDTNKSRGGYYVRATRSIP